MTFKHTVSQIYNQAKTISSSNSNFFAHKDGKAIQQEILIDNWKELCSSADDNTCTG